MAKAFIPTTEQVRSAYVRAMRNAFIASAGEHGEEFDRWLESVWSDKLKSETLAETLKIAQGSRDCV